MNERNQKETNKIKMTVKMEQSIVYSGPHC